jgi:hypothetical protein
VETRRVVRRLGLPHFLDNRFTDGGEFVSLTRRPLFTPRMILGNSFFRDRVDPGAIEQLEELGQLKNSMISSGFELATFRLVAYCLNQLRYRAAP